MTKLTLECAEWVALQLGGGAEACDDYSGRAMYGKTTVALTVDDDHQLMKVGLYIERFNEMHGEKNPIPRKTDNLGHQIVAY